MQQQMKTYEHPVRAMKSAKWKEDMNSPTPRTDGQGSSSSRHTHLSQDILLSTCYAPSSPSTPLGFC
ncbi:hypothetical protein CEXT_314331 [Caerostris extrusa]|uniref:Uncharacterized protein n=1 Tax=Caerostris extrusa TaxID=172846 RepID=A0AAV4XH37_CAEEX|nr:hypothetical protein CEXT_314331 [Caerostris extrusa]